MGIFVSTDPEDVFWNTYSYCNGDPINLTDPDGANPLVFAPIYIWGAKEIATAAALITSVIATGIAAHNISQMAAQNAEKASQAGSQANANASPSMAGGQSPNLPPDWQGDPNFVGSKSAASNKVIEAEFGNASPSDKARIKEICNKYGAQKVEGGFKFPNSRSAQQAASEIAGDLGRDPVKLRFSSYRDANFPLNKSKSVYQVTNSKGTIGFRKDIVGHSFDPRRHINVFNLDIDLNLHLFY